MAPAVADGFLAPEPPGKPLVFVLIQREKRIGGDICVLQNSSLYFLTFYFIFNWWKVALHFVLVSALQQRGSVSLSLSIHPILIFPYCVHKSVLY